MVLGAFSVDVPTLNRFFAVHYLFPFILSGLIGLHLFFLHEARSGEPLGISSIGLDGIPFGFYYIIKDLYGFIYYFLILAILVFYFPNILGHSDNYILANPTVTPAHIVPEWYFLPFYAILRSIPNKLGGVVAMFSALLSWVVLPFINTSELRSNDFRPINGFLFWTIFGNFLLLGWIGQQPVEYPYMEIGMFSTIYYFFSFLIFIPLFGFITDSNILYKFKWNIAKW